MKITQVSSEFVKENYQNPNLYRLVACDDGHHGHSHTAVRIKCIRKMTVEDVIESEDNPNVGFVLVETE